MHRTGLAILFLLAWTLPIDASQIIWRSSRKVHVTSDGQALNGRYVFELGVFAGAFVPTRDNVSEWATHWRVADRTYFDVTSSAFTSRYVERDNAAPFVKGARGYIWGYGIETHEWILMTSPAWTWPVASSTAFPSEWTTLTATSVIVGELTADPIEEPHLRLSDIGDQPLPVLTEAAWREREFTMAQEDDASVSDWLADPDGDGLSNLVEYVMGGSPLSYDSYSDVGVSLSNEGSALAVTLKPLTTRLGTATMQLSDDLVHWADAFSASADPLRPGTVRLMWELVDRRFVRIWVARP